MALKLDPWGDFSPFSMVPAILCVDRKIGGSNGEVKSLCSGGYDLKGIKVTLGMATDLDLTRLFLCQAIGKQSWFPLLYFGDKAGRGSPSLSESGKRPELGGGVGCRKPAL